MMRNNEELGAKINRSKADSSSTISIEAPSNLLWNSSSISPEYQFKI